MNPRKAGLPLLLPLVVILLFAGVILLERRGLDAQPRPTSLSLLTAHESGPPPVDESRAETWITYVSTIEYEDTYRQTLCDTLGSMRIPYRQIDLASQTLPDFSGVRTILHCSQALEPLTPYLNELHAWVEGGGHLGIMLSPYLDSAFQMFYRIMGIEEYGTDYERIDSCAYRSDLMPLLQDFTFTSDGDLENFALPVHLEEDSTVHITSADDMRIPLLWETPLRDGRVVVHNNTLTVGKDSRGLVLASLLALEDTLVYPIVNASMVFIDDFPAPQPEGFDERLLQDYGFGIQDFFRHHWWPDMRRLTQENGVRYTGVLIETYNDRVTPPFEAEEDAALLRFYASELLYAGGEIGLHGYNHMPLCLDGFSYPEDINYRTWPTEQDMELAMLELQRYGQALFDNAKFATYVPPSNYLSPEGQAMLRRALPDMRVISGLYLFEAGVPALVQEFREEQDGSISVPRITSGFVPDEYNWWVLSQELMLHGVFSHFIHPDDVLDDTRGAHYGWEAMYEAFSGMIIDVAEAYPPLRQMTAAEGAAAVQRFERLQIDRRMEEGRLMLTLEGFVDSAWLSLSCRETPTGIEGGSLHRITDQLYWIEATAPEITVLFGDAQ